MSRLALTAKSLAMRGMYVAAIPFTRKAPEHVRYELKQRLTRGSLADPAHRHRITFDTVEETPAMKIRREAAEAVAGLTAAQDWRGIAHLLGAWDKAGTKAGDDKRLFIEGLEAFSLSLRLDEWTAYGTPRPRKLLAEIDRLFDHHPNEFGLAAMAVWLRAETAWAIRGCGFSNSVREEDWQEILRLMEDARCYLEMSETKTSALLAYAAFKTAPFTATGGEHLKSLWATYIDLAPDCGWGNEHFGAWMQPKWYGDGHDFEATAMQAFARTHQHAGAAAYALMYTGASADDPAMFQSADIGLFAEGISDMIRINGRDPSYIAGIFGLLSNLALHRAPKSLPPDQREAWADRMELIARLAENTLVKNLTAICPADWAMKTEGALDAITQCMREAFDAGHNFAVTENGIELLA